MKQRHISKSIVCLFVFAAATNEMKLDLQYTLCTYTVADPGGCRIGRGPPPPNPPFFRPIFVFLADFCYFRARHRGIWIPGPSFSQILDPPLRTCIL